MCALTDSKITMPILLFPLIFLLICGCGNSGPTTARAPIIQTQQQIKEQRTSPLTFVTGVVSGVKISIQYGAPSVKGRSIWGDLVPYDEVWRTGANEATWIETERPMVIAGKRIPAGRFGLFTIPGASEWTVIINTDWDQWGAYYYSASNDLLRTTVPVLESTEDHEVMQFSIESAGIVFRWAGIEWTLPIQSV
jgi:hypothetical protein